jgi:hypothetical protein
MKEVQSLETQSINKPAIKHNNIQDLKPKPKFRDSLQCQEGKLAQAQHHKTFSFKWLDL